MEFISKLHPLVIHFPIAFIILYAILDTVNFFLKKNSLTNFSILVLFLGIIGGVLAVLSGNQSFQLISASGNISQLQIELIEHHEFFATITLWYYFFLAILRFYFMKKKKYNPRIHLLFVIFAIGGIYFLFEAARIGGKLVYEFGIGTKLFGK